MERTPCLVSFSGGHDSSLVLAAATRLARAEGLPDPIPVTWRSRELPEMDESCWQDAVVAELGLHDWIRMETGDELDYVGPVATRVAQRLGRVYPPNAHLHEPLAAEATGGALLTGFGGDQLFGQWRWAHVASVLSRRVPAAPRDVLRVPLARAPVPVRRAVAMHRAGDSGRAWLTPDADRAFARALAAELACEPPTWAPRLQWQATRRYLTLSLGSLAAIGDLHDCRIVNPLRDPVVLAAIGDAAHPHGFDGRPAALRTLFPTLHPRVLTDRRGKASFRGVFSRDASRTAARRWRGEHLDPALVDVPALQRVWRDDVPLRSALMLQQFVLQPRSAPVTPR